MRSFLYILIIIGSLGLSAYAQGSGSKPAPLPAGIAGWSGQDSDKLLKNAAIKSRIKKLLGAKSYAAFIASFETLTPISKDGDVLFASGCMIHACTHLESAIAINITNNTVHAAIFDEEKPTRFFNERGSSTPKPIADWASNLAAMKSGKP